MQLNIFFLALAYLFYFGHLGVMVPFLGLFLDARGFSSEQIGELMAFVTFARIIGPNLWSSIADKTQKGLPVLRFGALLTAFSFCLLFWMQGFWQITIAMGFVMMFWTAIAPQMETITLNSIDGDPKRYSSIRLWGSVGFILFSILSGLAVDKYGTDAILWSGSVLLSSLFIISLLIRSKHTKKLTDQATTSIWHFIKAKPFLLFMASSILLQFSFAPYYSFFALYMKDYGYTATEIGWLVSFGVAAEVIIFLFAGKLLNHFGVKLALMFCMFSTAARWAGLGLFAQHPAILLLSQSIHAFSFGLAHAAAMHFIHGHFDKHSQSRGQALYVSISFGVGGAAGSYVAGHMWQQGAGSLEVFMMATVSACIGGLVLFGMPGRTETASSVP